MTFICSPLGLVTGPVRPATLCLTGRSQPGRSASPVPPPWRSCGWKPIP